jgi:hypothetical protein
MATFAKPHPVSITIDGAGRVSGLLQAPKNACLCYVLAHGAGAGMSHPFMAAVAEWSQAATEKSKKPDHALDSSGL